MKSLLNLLGATLALAVVSQAATAKAADAEDVSGWYIAGAVTGSDLNKPHQTIANAPVRGSTLEVTNDVDFGWGGQAAVGYMLDHVRLEAEVGRTENRSRSYSATSPISITLPQEGDNNVTRYMANAYYDIPLAALPIQGFVGAGVGAADVYVSTYAAPARAPTAPPSQLLNFSRTVVAYQLMAGLSYPITSRLTLTAQYRWFDAGTIEGKDSRGQRATRDVAGNNFDLGLRYAF